MIPQYPFPNTFENLEELVSKVTCKPGWQFVLRDEEGALRLVITVPGKDSYNSERSITVAHCFPVPTATYNFESWLRWVFECCRRVENHELGEWFKVGGHRPFAPLHGPGEDPYEVHDYRSREDACVLQDGSVMEKDKL